MNQFSFLAILLLVLASMSMASSIIGEEAKRTVRTRLKVKVGDGTTTREFSGFQKIHHGKDVDNIPLEIFNSLSQWMATLKTIEEVSQVLNGYNSLQMSSPQTIQAFSNKVKQRMAEYFIFLKNLISGTTSIDQNPQMAVLVKVLFALLSSGNLPSNIPNPNSPDTLIPDSSPCLRNPCKYGGVCVPDGDTQYHCDCLYPFSGLHCENVDGCTPNRCNGDQCMTRGFRGGYSCLCNDGNSGSDCQTTPLAPNGCSDFPCKNGGTCITIGNGYKCSCKSSQFSGIHCENVDGCNPNPCQNNGKCTSGAHNGEYFCE